MEILEKINSIEMIKVTGSGECDLCNYGHMSDVIYPFDYKFESGNIYGIIDEFGNGGWILSEILAGKRKWINGRILINGVEISNNKMNEYGCYVGEDSGMKNWLTRRSFTVQEQIYYGVKKGISFCNNVDEIKKNFNLSDERFNRQIKYFSGERWKASMAIGYAQGKLVYCFPWMNSRYIKHLEEHIRFCARALLEVGAIIIIPTCRERSLLEVSGDCKFVYLTEKL